MRTKNIWTIVTLLVLVGLVAACAAPATPAEAPQPTAAAQAAAVTQAAPAYTTEGKVIYNVGFLKGHPVIRLMTLGFILGARELGYDYKLVLSDGSDYGKMAQDLEQANAEGAAAVVGFVADPAVGPAVAVLGESGIPFCSAHFRSRKESILGSPPGRQPKPSPTPRQQRRRWARSSAGRGERRASRHHAGQLQHGGKPGVQSLCGDDQGRVSRIHAAGCAGRGI